MPIIRFVAGLRANNGHLIIVITIFDTSSYSWHSIDRQKGGVAEDHHDSNSATENKKVSFFVRDYFSSSRVNESLSTPQVEQYIDGYIVWWVGRR